MAHAGGEEHQHGSPVGLELEHEDHPEATIRRWHVDLRAVWKDGAVVAVFSDAAQLRDRDAALLEVLARCFGGLPAGGGAASEVFLPGVGVEGPWRGVPARSRAYGSSSGGSMCGSCSRQNASAC
jgi:hypothetical protein